MTAKQTLTTADEAREQLIASGTTDTRVSEALALFQNVSRFVPAPTVHFAPVKYSASSNVTA